MEEAQQPVQEAENQPILQEVPENNTEVKAEQEAESPRVNVSSVMVRGVTESAHPCSFCIATKHIMCFRNQK